MRTLIWMLSAVIFGVGIYGCQSNGNEKIIEGGWVMESLSTDNYNAYGSQLGKPKFLFLPNGMYEIDIAGVVDTGKWELREDTVLIMKSEADPEKQMQTLHIQRLDDQKLVYKSVNDDGQVVVIELIRL